LVNAQIPMVVFQKRFSNVGMKWRPSNGANRNLYSQFFLVDMGLLVTEE